MTKVHYFWSQKSIQFIFDFDPEVEFYLNLGAFQNGDMLGIYFNLANWIEYVEGKSSFNKVDENGDAVTVDPFLKLRIQRQNFDGTAFRKLPNLDTYRRPRAKFMLQNISLAAKVVETLIENA